MVGPPGSGKTILAQQYVFHNATPERPAVYLTTVSEPLEKVLRYGQTMAFFDPAAVGRAVFYEDVGELLGAKDCPECWSGSTRWSRAPARDARG